MDIFAGISQADQELLRDAKVLRMTPSLPNYKMVGGVTAGMFPEIERILTENPFQRDAMLYAVSVKNLSKFGSVIDFLLYDFFPTWRPRIRQVRGGRLPNLACVSITISEYAAIVSCLKKAADEAYTQRLNRTVHPRSWKAFRNLVLAK